MTKSDMTKRKGMTTDHVSPGRNIAFLSFGLRASFVIRHSSFVISSP